MVSQAAEKTRSDVVSHGRLSRLNRLFFAGLIWGLAFNVEYVKLFGAYTALIFGSIAAIILVDISKLSPRLTFLEVITTFTWGHVLGFSWLPLMLERYFELPSLYSWAAFLLFAALSSLQFFVALRLSDALRVPLLERACLSLPLAWVATEIVYPRIFEWYFAYSFTENFWLMQTADIAGPALSGALIIWVATLLYRSFEQIKAQRVMTWATTHPLVAALGVCGFVYLYGAACPKLYQEDNTTSRISILTLHTGTPAMHTLDPQVSEQVTARVRDSLAKLGNNNDLIIFPESAILEPIFATYFEVEALLAQDGHDKLSPVMFGGAQVAERPGATETENSVFLFDKAARTLQVYQKQFGFPLAEANIFKSVFPALFDDVETPAPFTLLLRSHASRSKEITISPFICFESSIPRYVAERVRAEHPNLLVEVSNHNWFYGTQVSVMHELFARWRAAETRTPLIRVVNSGISSAFNILGERIESEDRSTDGISAGRIEITPYFQRTPSTAVAWGWLIHMALLLLVAGILTLRALCRMLGWDFGEACKSARSLCPLALVVVALLYPLGRILDSTALVVLGLISGVSPNPYVFNRFEGIDYWSLSTDLQVLTRSARLIRIPIDQHALATLPGPHHYHVAYLLPFTFSPVYPKEWWEPAVRYGFCTTKDREGELAKAFGIEDEVGSIKISLAERVPPFRDWTFRVVCPRKEE